MHEGLKVWSDPVSFGRASEIVWDVKVRTKAGQEVVYKASYVGNHYAGDGATRSTHGDRSRDSSVVQSRRPLRDSLANPESMMQRDRRLCLVLSSGEVHHLFFGLFWGSVSFEYNLTGIIVKPCENACGVFDQAHLTTILVTWTAAYYKKRIRSTECHFRDLRQNARENCCGHAQWAMREKRQRKKLQAVLHEWCQCKTNIPDGVAPIQSRLTQVLGVDLTCRPPSNYRYSRSIFQPRLRRAVTVEGDRAVFLRLRRS